MALLELLERDSASRGGFGLQILMEAMSKA